MRTAIVHDYLTQFGGAERVVAAMLPIWPGAPVYTTVYRPASTLPDFAAADVRTSWLDRLPAGRRIRGFAPLMPAAIRGLGVLDYDLVVSSSSGWAHGVRTSPRAFHVVYCHNPPRWLHETGSYLRSPTARMASWPLRRALTRWDYSAAARPNLYVANSKAVQAKVRNVYHRDACVVHPPVDVERFMPGPRGERFLVISRLLPYKRVDLAVAAANRAGWPLDVVGVGPEFDRLRSMAGPTVVFHGLLPDGEVTRLLESCAALCLPGVEDFGITAVEANAAGKPVVAYGAGGALETMQDGRTAVFFHRPTVDALQAAMRAVLRVEFDPMVLRHNAGRFHAGRFAERLVVAIDRAKAVATSP